MNNVFDVRDVLKNILKELEMNSSDIEYPFGLKTHWKDFDEITGGLQKGELIVVGAKPSMGKTTFVTEIAFRVALDSEQPVLIFSLENSSERIINNLISSAGKIDRNKLQRAEFNDYDLKRLSNATEQIASSKLFINDDPRTTLDKIRNTVNEFQGNKDEDIKDIALIVVDTLQLMSIPKYEGRRVEETSEIARGLKLLAREVNIPILVTSQINRSPDSRPNKRPFLFDLRDSGVIEEVADKVCFIYRDEIYNPESVDKGIAEIIIAKQRNGSLGTVRLAYQSNYSRFLSIDKDSEF